MRFARHPDAPARLVVFLAVAAASVLPYLGTLRRPFLNWDDYALILGNPFITRVTWHNIVQIFTPGSWGAFQPVRDMTYLIDYAIAGYNPLAYHLSNLAWYVATNLALYLLLATLGARRPAALFATLVFALHPVHVEAVAWLSARKESVAGCFLLLSAALYLRARRAGARRDGRRLYLASLGAALLAMLAKPVAVALPGVLCLFELLALKPATWRERWRGAVAIAPFVVMAGILTLLTIQVSAGGDTVKSLPAGGYRTVALTWPLSTVSHLRLLVWPAALSTRYPNVYLISWADPRFVQSVVTLLAVTLVAWRLRHRAPAGLLAWGWFLVTLLPVSGLVSISTLVADRYAFLPSVAVALVAAPAAGALMDTPRRALRVPLATAALALIGLLAWRSAGRAAVWHDNLTLWGNVVAVDPGNTLGRYAFANVQAEAGNLERAIVEYERALRQQPGSTIIMSALAQAYAVTGHPEKAERHYRRAIEIAPEDAELHAGLGDVLMVQQQWLEAIAAYDRAAAAGAAPSRLLVGRARAELGLERYGDASRHLEEVLGETSGARLPDVYLMLARAHLATGHATEALVAVELARRGATGPRPEVDALFGEALAAVGRRDEARAILARSLDSQGNSPGILATLGRIAQRNGESAEAIDWYRAALEVDSTAAGIWTALGEAEEGEGRIPAAESAYVAAARHDLSGRSAINLGAFFIQSGRLDRADSTFTAARTELGDDPDLLYNMACLASLRERTAEALAHLSLAAGRGFDRVDVVRDDPDLEPVRRLAGFDSVLARMRENADRITPPAPPKDAAALTTRER